MGKQIVDWVMAIYCIIIAVGGILTNGCLLFVILSKKDLRRKDYICFILNRTLLDFVYCLFLGLFQPFAILWAPTTNSEICTAAGFFELGLGLASIYSEPVLACNRYVSILYSNVYKKVYKMRNVYLMSFFVWVLGFLCAAPHLITDTLGRVTGLICSIKLGLDSVYVAVFANYLVILVGLVAVGFFNYKILRFLRQHQSQSMSNSQKSKLQNDKEMSKFIMVAAFFPMIFEVPAVATFWIRTFTPAVSDWVMCAGISIFLVSFVVNPIVTLSMVRPLRNEFSNKFHRLMGYTVVSELNNTVGPTTQNMYGNLSTVDGTISTKAPTKY